MTKKDYIVFARIFNEQLKTLPKDRHGDIYSTAYKLAEYLQEENELFDPTRFYEAIKKDL